MTMALILVLSIGMASDLPEPEVRVGSKTFTESVILGEIAVRLIEDAGTPVSHRRELGGTRILFNALKANELDVYPEYTGTISGDILANQGLGGEEAMRKALAERGVGMSRSLGFNNTYAIGMQEEVAARLRLSKLSDLKAQAGLRFGFSNEFMNRSDGWPGLRDRYELPQRDVRGLEHALAYRGLASGEIQATDLYSTDAEIKSYKLRVLEDDRHYFPNYECVWLYRADLPSRAPKAFAALQRLEGRIGADKMAEMNAAARIDRAPESMVVAGFVRAEFGIQPRLVVEGPWEPALRKTGEYSDPAPGAPHAGRDLAHGGDPGCDPAGDRRLSLGPAGCGHLVRRGGHPDHSVAGNPGVHDPLARDRGEARHRRAVSL